MLEACEFVTISVQVYAVRLIDRFEALIFAIADYEIFILDVLVQNMACFSAI